METNLVPNDSGNLCLFLEHDTTSEVRPCAKHSLFTLNRSVELKTMNTHDFVNFLNCMDIV